MKPSEINPLSKMIASGILPGMDIQFSKKIRITNQISLLLAAIASCYVFIFSFLGFIAEGLWLITGVVSLILCVFLNHKKRYISARLLCFATVVIAVYVYAVLFGKESGIYFVFFPCACLPWIYFEPKDRNYILSLTVISIACFFSYLLYYGTPYIITTPAVARYICFTIALAVFAYIYFCMRFMSEQNSKSEQFLKDTYQRFFEDIPTPMWIFDENSLRFLAVNQKAIESYGYTNHEFLSMRITDLFPAEAKLRNEKVLHDSLAICSGSDKGYVQHRKKNGSVFYAHILSNKTDYNGVNARVVQAIDVDDKVVTEQTLEELKISQEKMKTQDKELLELFRQKEVINKQLERYTYIVAHEIKSPLNSLSALLDMLNENMDVLEKEDVAEMIDKSLSASGYLSRMVDSILDYSRKSEAELIEEHIDVNALVLQVADMLNLNRKVNVRIDGTLPGITSKRLKLEQVFQNLIGNAIKYNDKEQGEVVITCEEEEVFYKFCVRDNGPGILKNDTAHIFKLFGTSSNESTNNDSSTGIGLNILKMIVEEQGGRIYVESVPAFGSSFYFQWRK